MCLCANLTYLKNPLVEAYWLSDQGWQHLGLILANTKLDLENPTLREWGFLFIRNITSWSEPVRAKLASLTLLDGSNPTQSPMAYDKESQKTFDAMGDPLKEMYLKEREKFKRDEEDQRKL